MTILENQHLAAMAGNETLRKEFPVFEQLRAKLLQPGIAHGCNCGPVAPGGPDYNSIKAALATMSQADKDRFKQLAGLPSVKIIYAVGHSTQTVVL